MQDQNPFNERGLVPLGPAGPRSRKQDEHTVLIPEEYAHLHADIERAQRPEGCFVVGVTSALYGEGKTTVAINLAGTMAHNSTARVSLVDGNLRNWDLQNLMNMPAATGLVDLLEGTEDEFAAILRRTHMENLSVVPAGRAAVNPARLIRSPMMDRVFETLRATNEYVVVDLAPVLPIADTKSMARLVDALVMVVRAGKTAREVVARAIETVGSDRVIGVVLNGAKTSIPGAFQGMFT